MITILPARLRNIHFPRSHLFHVTHAIVKILLFKDVNECDYFFSFTENASGISVVANEALIANDFLPALEAANCPDLGAPTGVFRVLQVDDDGGQELSGKRISDISEPLAEGRFSILYISTYQTDFVLVSESKLHSAINALRQDGFEVEYDGDDEIYSYPYTVEEEEDDAIDIPLSPVDPTQFLVNTEVLVNELQCVGLNRHYRSDWVTTVLKILCYPDLMLDCSQNHKRFCSFVATSQDISLIADTHIVESIDENLLMKEEDGSNLRVIQVHFSGSNVERCGIVKYISKPLSIEANINMLYLSTFMTANIIVSVNDLERAVSILSPTEKCYFTS
ncbi:hypothetical protein EDC94DRAFT_664238 [Helicostylum pulchrum]|nr:hypothetical protein EDC94DRAFT_664238 [Helicostylum pulchrum]